jgi:hypothetical protein
MGGVPRHRVLAVLRELHQEMKDPDQLHSEGVSAGGTKLRILLRGVNCQPLTILSTDIRALAIYGRHSTHAMIALLRVSWRGRQHLCL